MTIWASISSESIPLTAIYLFVTIPQFFTYLKIGLTTTFDISFDTPVYLRGVFGDESGTVNGGGVVCRVEPRERRHPRRHGLSGEWGAQRRDGGLNGSVGGTDRHSGDKSGSDRPVSHPRLTRCILHAASHIVLIDRNLRWYVSPLY